MTRKNYPSSEYRLLESLKPFLNYRKNTRYPLDIGDDAAIRTCSKGEQLVITADSFVQNVHFSLSYMTLEEAGYKTAAINLSDCAAMAAVPDGALIQVIFPKTLPPRSIVAGTKQLYKGLSRACRKWNFPIVGGNLSAGPCWIIDMTLLCRKEKRGRLLLRTGAQNGEGLWVTGTPGDSAAGLAALRKWGRSRVPARFKTLVSRHVRPQPRIEIGRALGGDHRVHALIDVSDGISKDSRTLSFENGLGIELVGEPVCVSPTARSLARELDVDWRNWYLNGGEDYELLFSAGPEFDPRMIAARYEIPLTRIGTFVRPGRGVLIRNARGVARHLATGGWDHLQRNPRQDTRPSLR